MINNKNNWDDIIVFKFKSSKRDTTLAVNAIKRKVNQYDKINNYIATYNSIIEASIDNKLFSSNIVTCCKGKTKSCGGYIWRYA